MKYLLFFFILLPLIYGCANTPTPQEKKEISAKETISQNKNDAEQARLEYLALQEKRKREGRL